jgi:uncharacterized membrane protein
LLYLDGYRAIGLILMVLVHGVNFWIDPDVNTPFTFWLRKLITGVPAPIFLMLVGASYILTREGRRRRGWGPGAIFRYCAKRSAVLLLIAYLYRASDVLFGLPWQSIKLGQVDVLNMIAVSFFLLSVADYFLTRFRGNVRWYLVLSWFFVVLTPVIRSRQFPDFIPWFISAYINGVSPQAYFTIFPYANYVFLGAFVSHHLFGGALDAPWKNGRILLIVLGLAAILSSLAPAVLPEWGLLTASLIPKVAFYAKAHLLLLGGLWLCYHFQERVGFGPLLLAGSQTMPAYWIHAKLVFILFAPFAAAAGWAGCGGLLAATYALTIVLTFGWVYCNRAFKQKSRERKAEETSGILQPAE